MNPLPADNVDQEPSGLSVAAVGVLFAVHVPLALAMNQWPSVATAHALGTFILALWLTSGGRDFGRTAVFAAYIAGAEVIWRVTEASVFWEFGKYATVALLVLACLRNAIRNPPLMPALYILLLAPSALLTIADPSDWRTVRGQLSFNLSGPLALAVCGWFFAQAQLRRADIRRVLVALIAPALGMAAIMILNILTNPDIKFSSDSNMAVTGGFGPNQVSATLGLAALAALFLVLDEACPRPLRGLAFGSLVLLAAQSAMTFSRGGLYNAVAGLLVALFFLAGDARSRARAILVTVALALTAHYLIIPRLDAFTGGALLTRFQDLNSSGRDQLLRADLDIWRANPIMGVGPGMAVASRESLVNSAGGAHTEFSRLLSEHGVLGLFAALCLIASAVGNVAAGRTPRQKAFVASLTVWSFAFMLHAAMRLVAPAFAYGLGFAMLPTADAPPAQAPVPSRRTLRPVTPRRILAPRPVPAARGISQ